MYYSFHLYAIRTDNYEKDDTIDAFTVNHLCSKLVKNVLPKMI